MSDASMVSAGCSMVTSGGVKTLGAGFGSSALSAGRGEREPPPPPRSGFAGTALGGGGGAMRTTLVIAFCTFALVPSRIRTATAIPWSSAEDANALGLVPRPQRSLT